MMPRHKLLPPSSSNRVRVPANYAAMYLQAHRRQRAAAGVVAPPAFSPDTVPGLSLWLDAGAITMVSPGDPIAQWDDLSGLGNHATQSDPARQAQWFSNVVNGRPVLRFVANTGYVTPLELNGPLTVFVVYAYSSTAFSALRVLQGANNWLIGPYALKHDFFNGSDFTDGPATVEDQFVAQAAWQDGSESKNWVNGAFVGNVLVGGGSPGALALGSEGAYLEGIDGDVAEVLAYDSALDATNLEALWNYFASKFALS